MELREVDVFKGRCCNNCKGFNDVKELYIAGSIIALCSECRVILKDILSKDIETGTSYQEKFIGTSWITIYGEKFRCECGNDLFGKYEVGTYGKVYRCTNCGTEYIGEKEI